MTLQNAQSLSLAAAGTSVIMFDPVSKATQLQITVSSTLPFADGATAFSGTFEVQTTLDVPTPGYTPPGGTRWASVSSVPFSVTTSSEGSSAGTFTLLSSYDGSAQYTILAPIAGIRLNIPAGDYVQGTVYVRALQLPAV